MTDKEFKHMSKSDLLDIIYEYQKKELEQSDLITEQNKKIAKLQEMVNDKKIRIENVGSIAEAALSLNHMFESAQASIDLYIAEIKEANAGKEAEADKILIEAKKDAEVIKQRAEAESRVIVDKAKRECDAMYSKIKELLQNYEELRGLLPSQFTAK